MKRLQMSLLQGTLDLLVLRVVSVGPRHGYDIAKRIEVLSREALSIGQGSLYPALHRLEERGFVKASWKASETGRRARFYALTAAGKRELTSSEHYWREFSTAIEHVLKGAGS